VGLPELVTTTPDAYVRVATELASDPARLANLRASLRDRMGSSPIMTAPAFARDVERSYHEMRQQAAR
jgi:predicted O-linked N-acetylglucosamine transferase (SPINDLY family)